ncbi:hypothetical protein O0L34_g18168 [Tuta absoluta]|nr:hypothetical protein O0L34_g18168 [Tuta absoluta]
MKMHSTACHAIFQYFQAALKATFNSDLEFTSYLIQHLNLNAPAEVSNFSAAGVGRWHLIYGGEASGKEAKLPYDVRATKKPSKWPLPPDTVTHGCGATRSCSMTVTS